MKKLKISLDAVERLNLALLQNKIPAIRSLEVENLGEISIENVTVVVKSDPIGILSGEVAIAQINPGEIYRIEIPDVRHSWDFFKNVQERVGGTLSVALTASTGEILAAKEQEIIIEPETVWLGQRAPLELLASHVMPNSEAVQKVLRNASELLKEKTGKSELDGYQSRNKERVYEIAQAIFLALRKEQVKYISPPASFELTGQKVRSPDQTVSGGMGTCLDLTLLYLACLEQAGIHPIAFLVKGHAFAGFWLEDKYLPRASEEDPQHYRKLIELQEIIVLEITALTSDSPIRFSTLEQLALDHFHKEEEFVCGIDIAHARRVAQIHPLNAQDAGPAFVREVADLEETEVFENKIFDEFIVSDEAISREGEIDSWKDKLLDLSFRNRLLNFKSNKGTIEILSKDVARMEDILADGTKFEILPQTNQSALTVNRTDLKEILSNQIDEGFLRKQLLTTIPEDRFPAILNSLFRSVVNSEEETGSNTLYLALGILCWRETDGSQIIRKSPILMVPVSLSKSRGNKFKLAMRDDDSVMNMTLLQKLKRDFDLDFPGLDPLPEDESGIDVPRVFSTFRHVIRDYRGWEVKEEVWLGEFSFQKYLMWKELNNQYEEMLESPVTRQIMTGVAPAAVPDFVEEHDVEHILHPKEVYCPLSADSSQMAAILSAAKGSSFVLQGPPGTGKSQTIANMIAHCLGMGKRVLFVSEKRVALEVVFKRLQEIGLGDFCLELHSRKSEKKEVVRSFYKSLEHAPASLDGEWDQVSHGLKNSRERLNEYFDELHAKNEAGISAFRAFGTATRSADTFLVDLEIDEFLQFESSKLTNIRDRLAKWVGYANSLSKEVFSVWNFVQIKDWSSAAEDGMIQTSRIVESSYTTVAEYERTGKIPLPAQKDWSLSDWSTFNQLLAHLMAIPAVTIDLEKISDFRDFKSKFTAHIDTLKDHFEESAQLNSVFNKDITEIDYAALKDELESSNSGFVLFRMVKKNKLRSKLKTIVRGKLQPLDSYSQIISKGIAFKQGLALATDAGKFIESYTAQEYSIGRDEEFRMAVDWFEDLQEMLVTLYSSDIENYSRVRTRILELLKSSEILRSPTSELQKELMAFKDALGDLIEVVRKLETTLKMDSGFAECTLSELRNKIETLRLNASCFRDVAAMNTIRDQLCELGLSPLFDAVSAGKVLREEIEHVFNYNFHRQWLSERQAESQVLNNATGKQLDLNDVEFKNTDYTYRNLSQKALVSKISTHKPKLGGFIVPDSPVGVIVKEHNKTRRHLPIRRFLQEIRPVAHLLKPCYLMSPMSVSQYLPVAPDFDVVIFDEASQIPPWDAIGSISRGKQAIVVGDNKQLPPTAFFSNQGDGESDEMVDCESVLQMFGSLFPEMLLKWHYRSRSESLISFSNYHIYDNRLHTFPSAETNDNKVSLEIVTGNDAYYDRSKSRTNRGEARAVVNEIFSRLRSGHSSSIGVVTFSSAQSTLISDLIDAQLLVESKFESAFDVSNPEYVFVKNLENVQGDERDLILFSIGYGKDQLGRINRNFGPLNNSGGERRLNVAVSRARCEVKIFSNFHPREFDVSGSTSEGLRLLKEYLLYAEGGRASLIRQASGSNIDEFDSVFEQQVANRLREKGWQVRTQIGVGGYRVDLGIVHPSHEGTYLAGIECDGARYHSAKSARDRDILRQLVLEGLGWNILRIWSTDWWYDATKCIDDIDEKLKQLLNEPAKTSAAQKNGVPDSSPNVSHTQTEDSNKNEDAGILEKEKPVFDTSKISLSCHGDFFFSRNLVEQQLREVVEHLAPVSRDECFTIVSRAWGFSRKGNRIEQFLDECSKGIHRTQGGDQEFFWKSAEQVQTLDSFRIPAIGTKRDPSSVAPEELRFAFLPILKANIQIQKADLFREVAKSLGSQALTGKTIAAMEPGLKFLKDNGWVKVQDDIVTYHVESN
ncbi:MAG: DUF3320 domain-containing protein [Cryomorphaceae bacterium]|nr:MAG: DUF3320 domain-containing protein [Cryomorphaceae bacterium]